MAVAWLSVDAASNDSDEILAAYRRSIDNIDAALVLLLAERFKVTAMVGIHKAKSGLPAREVEREEAQIARLRKLADEAGLDQTFAERFLRMVMTEVVRKHKLFYDIGESVTTRNPIIEE